MEFPTSLRLSSIFLCFLLASVFILLMSSCCMATLTKEDQASIDEIRAYVESLDTYKHSTAGPASSYKDSATDFATKQQSDHLSSLPSSSAKSAQPRQQQQFCSADRQSDCIHSSKQASNQPSLSSSIPDIMPVGGHSILNDLMGHTDYSNMNVNDLLKELTDLTVKYPEEVESIINMYQGMLKNLENVQQ